MTMVMIIVGTGCIAGDSVSGDELDAPLLDPFFYNDFKIQTLDKLLQNLGM